MAAPGSRKSPSVADHLLREPYRFEFFQAVRMLERMAMQRAEAGDGGDGPAVAARGATGGAAGVGTGDVPGDEHDDIASMSARRLGIGRDASPEREIVRFRTLPSMSFAAAEIAQLRTPATPERNAKVDKPPLEMVVTFMGLTGPNGVLPDHYTTLLIERLRDRDFSLNDYLDLFNHRMISMFYRAWEKYCFPVSYERFRLDERERLGGAAAKGTTSAGAIGRTESGHGDDQFTAGLYSLIGLGTPGHRGRLSFDDEAALYYAGHLAHYPRNAINLENLLADYFDIAVRVLQYRGQWLYLARDDRSALPGDEFPDGLNNQLGASLVVGERVWDVQSRFRVRLGPLTYAQYRLFMPDGHSMLQLAHWVRLYVGPEFDFEAQPVLLAEQVPQCHLGSTTDEPRLGWNTFVRSQPFARDFEGALFSLETV